MTDKTREILKVAFITDADAMAKIEFEEKLRCATLELKNSNEDYANLSASTFVVDNSSKAWKKKEHFTKVFEDEILHATEEYDIKRHEVSFLRSLSPYLGWQLNLIVDRDTGEPLNQNALAKLLGVDRKTVQRNMNSLEKKLCIIKIKYDNNIYYIVNPYLMYAGSKINMILPSLFDNREYNKSRTNRRKTIQESLKIKG